MSTACPGLAALGKEWLKATDNSIFRFKNRDGREAAFAAYQQKFILCPVLASIASRSSQFVSADSPCPDLTGGNSALNSEQTPS